MKFLIALAIAVLASSATTTQNPSQSIHAELDVRQTSYVNEGHEAEPEPQTIHDNKFTLKMSGISNMKIDVTDHSVTDGQPWEGLSDITCGGGECAITIRSGRKKSEKVARWFDQVVSPGSSIACYTDDHRPGLLNFGIKGTMSFVYRGKTYTGQKIVIAQGNVFSRNNWWMGGPNMRTIINMPGFTIVAYQFFTTSSSIAMVRFNPLLACVSHMHMGIIAELP